MYGCRPFCADQRTAEGDLGTKPMLGRLSTSRGEFPTMKKSGRGRGVHSNAAFGVYYLDVHGKLLIVSWLVSWLSIFTYLTDVSNLLIQGL